MMMGSEMKANMLEKGHDIGTGIEILTFWRGVEIANMRIQPLEVTKTTMAANRQDGFAGSIKRVWGRGGVFGCKSLLPHLPSPH